MRFGKLPPRSDYRTLRFSEYLLPDLPRPSPAFDNLARIYSALGESDPSVLFPIDGNDRYGCCTIAALAHLDTIFDGLTGQRIVMSAAEVVRIYLDLTGGADIGLICLDVLNYWCKNVISGDNIDSFAKVSARNHDNVKSAISLFGGLYIGFQCQEDTLKDFRARRPWTPGPLTYDGHAVVVVGYDDEHLTTLTWGNTQKGTWAWFDECCDEAYAILPSEARLAGFSAQGFDFTRLAQDLARVKG